MDHHSALRRLQTPALLRTALAYAVFDRTKLDPFFDPIELEHSVRNAAEVVAELASELQEPRDYSPRTAYAYFYPKNKLCDRRMVYTPIKDLTVRYALAILFAAEIETEVHPQCFANRRATGNEAEVRFTEDFATAGWAGFCRWQREQCETNSVLLRTDISAFYDAISHDYLKQAVCRQLLIPERCPLMDLFHKLLQVQVIYYSPSNNHIEGPAVMRQGLPIGDGLGGFLANILLKDVDDAMAAANATYGRYVDDIRLFGQSRCEVLRQLRILQEQLLRKGLNLNSSKTKIAESHDDVEDLMSRNYGLTDYGDEEPTRAGLAAVAQIDQPFTAFARTFSADDELTDDNARDFCKYLSVCSSDGTPIVAIPDRQNWHIDCLREIIRRWRGSCKHASWLLVQTATYRGVPVNVQHRALEVCMFNLPLRQGILAKEVLQTRGSLTWRVRHDLLGEIDSSVSG